jgi:ABC-type Mn2+/Zn2+ transport system permease subunit
MNLIAVAMIMLGVVLSLFGLFLVLRRRKATGIAISLLGVGVVAFPFLVSFYLR